MTLDEWVDTTPGMAQLRADIRTHVQQISGGNLHDSEVDDIVRCSMISVREAVQR